MWVSLLRVWQIRLPWWVAWSDTPQGLSLALINLFIGLLDEVKEV